MSTDDIVSTRRTLEALLAKADEDGYRRSTRVIYAASDGREHLPMRFVVQAQTARENERTA